MTKKQRLEVYNKYGGRCAYCGQTITYIEMQVDHKVPVAVYGYNWQGKRHSKKDFIAIFGQEKYDAIHGIDNLMPACVYCNHHKRQWTLEMYRDIVSKITVKVSKDYLVKRGIRYGIIETKEWDKKFYFEKVEENKQKEI